MKLPPAHPATLAWMRIVIAAHSLWILLSRDPAGVAALPAVIWQGIDRGYRLRFILMPGFPVIESVIWICAVVSLCGVLIGIGTRVFGVIAALCLYHIAPLQGLLAVGGLWGKGLTIDTLALPILACAACEDRWSVRRWISGAPERDPVTYGWAVTLVRLLFAQIYLFSGLAKLRVAGLGWVSVETIRNQILVFGLADPALKTPLNDWIVARPGVCLALAAATIGLELVFIMAVFVRVVRLPLAVAAVFFHVGLWASFGLRFLNLPHLLLFVDIGSTRAQEPTVSQRAAP